eukprot:1180711-Prorocentrum_minimum.AAC.8
MWWVLCPVWGRVRAHRTRALLLCHVCVTFVSCLCHVCHRELARGSRRRRPVDATLQVRGEKILARFTRGVGLPVAPKAAPALCGGQSVASKVCACVTGLSCFVTLVLRFHHAGAVLHAGGGAWIWSSAVQRRRVLREGRRHPNGPQRRPRLVNPPLSAANSSSQR